MDPTLAGFQSFVQNQMGIAPTVLNPNSQYVTWAYGVAVEMVNQNIRLASPLTYALAVYNCAASNLVNFAQDPSGFFNNLRQTLGLNSLLGGIVQSASDEGTSGSLAVPDFVRNMSLSELQYVKDPWGRQYLAFAQRYGTVWGLN